MMMFHAKFLPCAAVAAVLSLGAFTSAEAATILKLSLGETGPDVEFSGGAGGILSTVDDGDASTTGEQNTAVDFVGFLSGMSDIVLDNASYTLDGLMASGAGVLLPGGAVSQLFSGGEFQLYDDSNNLLLDVDLTSTIFAGVVGSETGAEFTITDGIVAGGSLAPLLVQNSVNFSIGLSGINGGAGLSVTPIGPPIGVPPLEFTPVAINQFVANATKIIGAERIPEPATGVLLALAAISISGPAVLRRRR